MSRVLKECFGTVISSLKKMKECVRCELLRECRAINWTEGDSELPAVVVRRPHAADEGDAVEAGDSSGDRRS